MGYTNSHVDLLISFLLEVPAIPVFLGACFFLLAIWIPFVLTCGRVGCEVSGQGVGRWGERRPLCTPKNKMLKRYWGKKKVLNLWPCLTLCCCFSREVSLFLSAWLAWEGGSESASLLANLAQAVETQRFLRNVSDCDSTGPAQRHVFIMYGWRNYLSPGGHVSLCISFSPLPSSPFLCPLSLSLSFWGSLPTPWPPHSQFGSAHQCLHPSSLPRPRLPLLFAQSPSCCPGVAFLFLSPICLVFFQLPLSHSICASLCNTSFLSTLKLAITFSCYIKVHQQHLVYWWISFYLNSAKKGIFIKWEQRENMKSSKGTTERSSLRGWGCGGGGRRGGIRRGWTDIALLYPFK